MNKRGDIPITILVIGVFAICGLAMISFFLSVNNQKAGFENIRVIEEIKFENEKYLFYEALGLSESEIKDFTGFNKSINGFFAENKAKPLFIPVGNYKTVFSVEYYPK